MNQFPKAALSQHIAVLGKTGSGKSYAVRGIVEGLLDDNAREVTVMAINASQVRIGIKAPRDVSVDREEIAIRKELEVKQA